MDRICRYCTHYTEGVSERQRNEWSGTNWGRHATGVCNLYFPRGYIGRKPPHPAMATGSCFQFEGKDEDQITFEEAEK